MFFCCCCCDICGFNRHLYSCSSNANIQSGLTPKRKRRAVPVESYIARCRATQFHVWFFHVVFSAGTCQNNKLFPPWTDPGHLAKPPSSPAFPTICFHFCAPHGRCILPSPLVEPFRRPSWTGWPGTPMRPRCGGRHFCWQAELPTAWRFVSGRSLVMGKAWERITMRKIKKTNLYDLYVFF